jgi:hypothetical protein
MAKNGSRVDRVSSSSCVGGRHRRCFLEHFQHYPIFGHSLGFSRLRAFSACPRALNKPTTVVSTLADPFDVSGEVLVIFALPVLRRSCLQPAESFASEPARIS